MSYTVPHFIDGKTVTITSTPSHTIYNPALGEAIGKVHFANQPICEQAIQAAKTAWPAWAQTTAVKKIQVFFKFRALLEQHQHELARMVTREHGKTLSDAQGSIARAIEVIEWHCGLLQQLQGTYSANVSTNIDCYTFRQPLGVCAGVSPFNFPVMVPIWMLMPALSCGNTFILKPSEQDPSAAIFLLQLLQDAGLPDGVANCVQGDKTAVEHLLVHPDIRAFTAVASTPVAQAIYTTAIQHGKRAHTFGGAKNHAVVMPDADLNQTAQAIIGAAYGSAGERCMAISVVVAVGTETADALCAQLIPLVQQIRIEPGDAEHCDMGPLISQAHRNRVLQAINQGVAEGANLVVDGRNFSHPRHPAGFFIGPSLFDHVTPDMALYQQEIFGPVLIIVRVDHFEQALKLVNQHQYGNGTAIFTRDGYLGREYSQRVQVGMVGINIPIPVPIASHPFGGWKQSVFGDCNMHGLESIHFYTQLKTVTSKWPANLQEKSEFTMPRNG